MIRLIIPRIVVDGVFAHAQAELPEECCGILTGRFTNDVGTIVSSIALVNELHSPTAYRSEPRSLFTAMRTLREQSFDLVGIYHSHPKSPAKPSRRDRDEWTYAEAACVIVGLSGGSPELRAWRMNESTPSEIPIDIG